MTKTILKNTTALALCLGLGLPTTLPAQTAGADVQIEAQRPGESAMEYKQRLNKARLDARLAAQQGDGAAESDEPAPADDAADTARSEAQAARQAERQAQRQAEREAARAELQAERKAQRQAEREAARAELQAERQAERQAARAAAAAAANGGEAAQVTNQTVTEDNSRSSSEEFTNRVDQNVRTQGNPDERAYAPGGSMDPDAGAAGSNTANTAAPARSGKNDGLSNVGKLAILGLGAYAVGKILSNGDKVVSNTGDRVVVERNGDFVVLKDDDVLIRRPGSDVKTETFADGSTRSTVSNADGVRIVTIRAADGTVLRRTRIMPNGQEVVLFDDTRQVAAVEVNKLPQVTDRTVEYGKTDEAELQRALAANLQGLDRRFSLSQIRNIAAVRKLVPEIAVNQVNFETGSATIRPEEARELAALGRAMKDTITANPGSVFLVEGHTDAVGGGGYNLALSDRRAETLALALTEYFDVPPENMIVQGYGESDLKVMTEGASRINRRASVRNITALLN